MQPVDMKRTKEEKKDREKEMSPEAVGEDSIEDYHYGLRISLGEEEIKKVGLTSFNVGDELAIEGSVKVVSYSQNENENNSSRNVELLVTKLGLESQSKKLKNRYPNS